MNKRKFSSIFLIFLFFAPFIFSYAPIVVMAQNNNDKPYADVNGEIFISPEEQTLAMNFFQVDTTSYKFNELGRGVDGFIRDVSNESHTEYMPLVITGGQPYDLDIINKGNVQQMIDGELQSIYVWEFWYKYTITMWTSGTVEILGAYRDDKTNLLYKEGWGFDPWGLGHKEQNDAFMYFENYHINPNWYVDLESWKWAGKLSFDIDIFPTLSFPPMLNYSGEGSWAYSGIHYGFLPTTFLSVDQGFSEEFDVFVDGSNIANLTTAQDHLSEGRYPSGGDRPHDAYYRGFTTFIENSPEVIVAPPNNTACVVTAEYTGSDLQVANGFDHTKFSRLDEQRSINVELVGLQLKPETVIVGGEHYYHYYQWNNGLINLGGIFSGGSGSNKKEEVVIGFFIKNVYQLLRFKTGVRIVTTYNWTPEEAIRTTLGDPQTPPNVQHGDILIHAGMSGALTAQRPPTLLEKLLEYLWIIIIVVVAIVGLCVFSRMRGGAPKTEQKFEFKVAHAPAPAPPARISDAKRKPKRKQKRKLRQ